MTLGKWKTTAIPLLSCWWFGVSVILFLWCFYILQTIHLKKKPYLSWQLHFYWWWFLEDCIFCCCCSCKEHILANSSLITPEFNLGLFSCDCSGKIIKLLNMHSCFNYYVSPQLVSLKDLMYSLMFKIPKLFSTFENFSWHWI